MAIGFVQQPGNDAEQGGLSATARPHQHGQFAVIRFKIDAPQSEQLRFPGPEFFGDVPAEDCRLFELLHDG